MSSCWFFSLDAVLKKGLDLLLPATPQGRAQSVDRLSVRPCGRLTTTPPQPPRFHHKVHKVPTFRVARGARSALSRAGSGHGRAGSSDNAALCPGQTIAAPAPWDRDLSPQVLAIIKGARSLYPTGPSHRLPRHIMGRYPTPPPVRARRPSWLLSTGLVIKLARVAGVDSSRLTALMRVTRCARTTAHRAPRFASFNKRRDRGAPPRAPRRSVR